MSQPAWLLAALYITPVILVCYYLFGRSSPSSATVKALPEMEISEIYVYPIKSLRAIKLASAIATPHGFAHDRSFMLLEKTPTGYKNMAVASYPQMTQFLQEISPPPDNTSSSSTANSTLTIHYLAHGSTANQSSLTIPLTPSTSTLPTLEISLHDSPTTAYRMPPSYNTWFSTCFGFDVELVYLGSHRRSPRFSNLAPSSPANPAEPKLSHSLTFTDCAPYLITSTPSLSSVSSRIASEMDITKFRPNILLSGAKEAWDEDFWSRICIKSAKEAAAAAGGGEETEIALLHNCVRCKSINIDYATGKPGEGVKGEVLKRLQGDRRVDKGARWSPVFGRYGFWVGGSGGKEKGKEEVVWRVGDKVRVTGVNRERTVWSWPNLG
ncbi:hypothetical protein COCMIDRAFT_79928 [Bipolaris oryzae ATCC 44560]|uniref:MOSC domain-containing protein n=1 Tax=Bipolaris oryzae ATCC 44560 TaxID=930090 RepID=W6ZH74_COCMI|nr:uncharacterized protein COCMIDRAFT_79928 [Bipolaris oryzae ATCC 44560]EUC51207.1 hypothetical protein COCMIDRAFT_79928 [Bipolaris oryzae ATCC 44560]